MTFWGAVLIAALWIVGTSEAFQNCFQEQKAADRYKALHESPSVIVRSVVRLDINRVCVGDFADKNEGALTALAGFIVALFTFTLWRSTDKLWEAGEKQRELSEDTAKRQLRAYVVIKPSLLAVENGEARVECKIKNLGTTPATYVDTAIIAWLGIYPGPAETQIIEYDDESTWIGPGDEITIWHDVGGLTWPVLEEIRAERKAIWATIEVAYTDTFGAQWETEGHFFMTGNYIDDLTDRRMHIEHYKAT